MHSENSLWPAKKFCINITFQTVNLTGSDRSKTLACAVVRLLNPHISLPFSNLCVGLRSMNALNINFSLTDKILTTSRTISLSPQPYLSSPPSQYPLLICCHPFSSTNRLLTQNHRSLITDRPARSATAGLHEARPCRCCFYSVVQK